MGIKISNLTFEQRLVEWCSLRTKAELLPLEDSLILINNFWLDPKKKWVPYYLTWDDQPNWPDPWQLLSDDVYCNLAKALGILYTISLLDRADMADAELILAEDGSNLVLVAKEKYILNWNRDSIVNNKPKVTPIQKLKQHQIK